MAGWHGAAVSNHGVDELTISYGQKSNRLVHLSWHTCMICGTGLHCRTAVTAFLLMATPGSSHCRNSSLPQPQHTIKQQLLATPVHAVPHLTPAVIHAGMDAFRPLMPLPVV
jgi:hypothetical protein